MPLPEDLRHAIGAMREPELQEVESAIAGRRVELTAARQKLAASPLQNAVIWSLACLALFFGVDGAVFHSGWYMSYLEPNSSAGQLESRIFWLRHEAPAVEVAVFGDSRIGEGFSARAATEASGGKPRFRNMAVAGSTARVWYYLLRDADPRRDRFSTVVFALDRYSDRDGEDQANRFADMNYVVGRLRLTDCPEFTLSFAPEYRSRILSGCVLRGLPLREDLHALLEKPSDRFKAAKDWRNNGHGYLDGYGGKEEGLAGLTVDYATRTIHFPPEAKDWQKDTVRGTLLPDPVPQTGKLREYRMHWLGKIVDFYKGTKTRVVLLEMPRGPVPTLESGVPSYAVDAMRSKPNVTVLPVDAFRDLEQPDLFADGLHLNRKGRPIFSEHLARKLAELGGA